jgi:hypothetical protein
MQEESAITTIYVYLLDEGTDVWRPVDATCIKGDTYQINPESAIPETETWQFLPGDIVRCEEQGFSDGKHLVAIEKMANESK